ncbi:DUF6660 family protein [Sphingobacterium thalpophilum]|uniref:DUF6660 family protein n=1 Tax=Sphingobacterium thalpophilum TaxID=259 RepID=UPI0024A67F54|nr:DUF6660 family protein [Sphingobacterium thalpophilum]
MRLIVFILIAYILGLSFVPCSDTDPRIEETTVEMQLSHSHTHEEDTDACSIFCYCNCCSGNITVFEYQLPRIDGIPVTIYFDSRMPVFNSAVVSNYFGTIWQPPKINA